MVQRLEQWEMHNPAALRCQMPGSHSEWCVCKILTPVCKHNGFKVLHFTFCPHSTCAHPPVMFYVCSSLFVFNSPSLFFYPLALSSFFPQPSFPSFLCFLCLFLSSFSFHLFFPLSSLAPGWWWGCLITLSQAHIRTLSFGPKAGCLWLRLMVKLHRLLF